VLLTVARSWTLLQQPLQSIQVDNPFNQTGPLWSVALSIARSSSSVSATPAITILHATNTFIKRRCVLDVVIGTIVNFDDSNGITPRLLIRKMIRRSSADHRPENLLRAQLGRNIAPIAAMTLLDSAPRRQARGRRLTSHWSHITSPSNFAFGRAEFHAVE